MYHLPPIDKCPWVFMIQILKNEKKAFKLEDVKYVNVRKYTELRRSNIVKAVG